MGYFFDFCDIIKSVKAVAIKSNSIKEFKMSNKKRVYISDKAYIRLKEMTRENKDKLNRNRGMCGMLDILILGEVTSEGSGRPRKI